MIVIPTICIEFYEILKLSDAGLIFMVAFRPHAHDTKAQGSKHNSVGHPWYLQNSMKQVTGCPVNRNQVYSIFIWSRSFVSQQYLQK